MLCHFRFHSTSLSYEAASVDFKALYMQGENKNKYLFCGLLCFNMAARWDVKWTQEKKKKRTKDAAAEINEKDLSRTAHDLIFLWGRFVILITTHFDYLSFNLLITSLRYRFQRTSELFFHILRGFAWFCVFCHFDCSHFQCYLLDNLRFREVKLLKIPTNINFIF